jgi:biopolymer transport protein ExbB
MPNRRPFVSLVLPLFAILAVTFVLQSSLEAQSRSSRADESESARESVDESASADQVAEQSLFGILRQGGLVMIPIIACSFLTLVFVFERFISLRRGRVIPAPFVKKFLHQLREGKLDKESALELCNESSSPVAEVFAGAVRRWGRPTVEVEQAILDAQERAAIGLRRYVKLFSAVANITPLLGLLGTVFGIIRMFKEIADADAMNRVERLSHGISEALLCTAGGLCVAIPALCFYVFFGSRVERLCHDLDILGQELVGLISAEALADAKSNRLARRNTAA